MQAVTFEDAQYRYDNLMPCESDTDHEQCTRCGKYVMHDETLRLSTSKIVCKDCWKEMKIARKQQSPSNEPPKCLNGPMDCFSLVTMVAFMKRMEGRD